MTWTALDQHLIAKAIYPLSKDIPHVLPLRIGDTLIITSKCEEWYHGYCILKSSIKSKSGIFPANHVRVVRNVPNLSKERLSSGDYSTDEIKSTMMSTIAIQTSLILSYLSALEEVNDTARFNECEMYFNKLIELFYEIANWSVNKDELIKLENQFRYISKIYSLLRGDVVVRHRPFTVTSVVNLPFTKLHQLYLNSQTKTDQADGSEEVKSGTSQIIQSHCLQIVVENFEFFGHTEEFVLQWMMIDILNETHHETFWQPIKEPKKGRPLWMGEKFIFADISDEIVKENFYLVVYVFRMGQLLTDPNKLLTCKFRRPLAFGSCSLKEVASAAEKTTIILHCLSDADFLKSPKEILKIKFPVPPQYRLVQISSTIIDQNHVGFDVSEQSHILRSVLLRSDIPYEYDRNSLYIKLDSAEFEKANKASQRNVEAQLFILNEQGVKMPCFSSNPNRENMTEYFSSVTYHSNSPRWREIIKINLAELNPEECHILVNFYHCSTKDKKNDERKYFACCFLRLSEYFESSLSKKSYVLNMQKSPESMKPNPKNYLTKVTTSQQESDKSLTKEFCKIEIFLCSTFISANKSINNFLSMRFHENLSIMFIRECLMEIQNIKNEDFLKPKLRLDIMTAVKTLIIDKIYKFNSLIERDLFITWQSLSYKYIHFGMDIELLSHLRGSFGFLDCLLKGIRHLLGEVHQFDISFDVLNVVFTSLGPLFEILSTFMETETQYEVSQRLTEVLKYFLNFFEGHYNPEPGNDIRILIFKLLINNLKNISKLLSVDTILDFFKKLFDSISFKNGKILPREKLEFFHKTLNYDVNTESFVISFHPALELCLAQIEKESHLVLLATEVVIQLLKQCKLLSKEDRVDLISSTTMKTLFTQSFKVLTKLYYSENTENKITASTEELDQAKQAQSKAANYHNATATKFSAECQKLCSMLIEYLEEWVQISNEYISLKEFYIILINMRLILERNIYPKEWLSMYLKMSSICGEVLKKISNCFDNKNEEAYNALTLSYFEACFTFIMQSSLQLQDFPFAKSQEIVEKYGDMRVDIVDCFLNVWKNKPADLDIFDKDVVVQVTRKVLNISFISAPRIRYKTIPLLVHTITNWLDKCGDIKEVLCDLISETEQILRDGRCDEAYHATLIQILVLKRMSSDVEEVIESFATLINLHLEYRKLSSGSYNILHSQFLIYAFLKFYQEKVDIFAHYQHYSNKFSQMLESEEHYFEAALVLKQQYDCIHWESEEVTFDDIFYKNYTGIGSEQLKDHLAKRIIDLLNQAKEYEYAADICQELHCHYLTEYKYKDLNPLLKQLARYYELITTEPRLMLNYYRVTFIGGTLPSYMRQHRDYIVKGSMWFKTSTISAMLKSAFPNTIIKSYQSSPPTESPIDPIMTIYLAKMEPIPSNLEVVKNSKMSFKIRSFYKDHKINCFFSDHPYHKGVMDKNNEVKSLHLSRINVVSNMTMPNEFMWNPIIHEEREIFTPIEVAIETVERKNSVIMDMIHELEENELKDLRPFTMLLTGTLDAGVNGGMPKYIEAFFSDLNPENHINTDLLTCFRDVLMEQKNVLTEALALHRKLAPVAILPMHERLEECFECLMRSIIDLDVSRKRSFSNMRSLDDIYAHIRDFMAKNSDEMENVIHEREKVTLRETFLSSATSMKNLSEEIQGSSNCSSPNINHPSSTSRSMSNSQLDVELERCRLTPGSPRRRQASSNDESLIQEIAKQYVKKQQGETLSPSMSTPDMRPSAISDPIVQTMKSPPLPPREIPSFEASEGSSQVGGPKSLKTYIWTLVSRGKEIKSTNGKYCIEPRRKSKPNIADIFKSTDQ